MVEPGTYKEMVVITKDVTLESDASQQNAVANTIIDATGLQYGILLKGFAASGSQVIGLTVENAQQEGILAVGPITALTFSGNVITNNAIGPIPPNTDFEALHLMGATHSTIINNQVVDNGDGGIYLTDETGPNAYNFVINNTVKGNKIDCGITLASHVANSGVHDNVVEGNDAEDNGAAGVFMGTPVPGGAVYNNIVKGNTIKDNGMDGVVMHTHAPGSNVSNNIIFDNIISGNKADGEVTSGPVGVSLGASLSPITNTFVFGNAISDDTYNVYISDLARGTFSMQNLFLPF
ncbi:MAG: right-handed parallel beta-helix repeat-containing protein [Alicyclobacillus sp.]|nr:right-handed parallel beta-helix repeat-containing protein [Alicyclobacillus sp.]